MRFSVIIRGVEVRCDGLQDLDELIHLASANGLQPTGDAPAPRKRRPGPGRPPKNGRPEKDIKREEACAKNLAFLRLVGEAGPRGIRSTELVESMALPSPRAIGGLVTNLCRDLKDLGIAKSDVCRALGSGEKRRWLRAPHIDKAIAGLEKLRGGERG